MLIKKGDLIEIYQRLSAVFLLFPLFFNRISFGASGSYNSSNSVALPFHNFEPFALYFICILFYINFIKKESFIAKVLICLFSILFIQLFYLLFYHLSPLNGLTENYLIRFLRAYFYLGAVLVYALMMFNPDIFNKVLYGFLRVIVIISLISYFSNFYFHTPPFLLHYQVGYDYYRIQAFFSEPSAAAAPFSALMIYSFYKKKYLLVLISCVAIIFTKSPTTFLTIIISSLIILVGIKKYRIAVFVLTVSFIISLISFILFTDLGDFIKVLNNGDSSVFSAFGRLISGIDEIKSGGNSGSNGRYQGVQEMMNAMASNNLYYTGYGFNSAPEYFISIYGDVRDFALQFSILFSYGILGVVVFYSLLFISYIRLYKYNYSSYLLFTPFIVSSFLNSAEGLVMYQITYLCLFSFLFRNNLNELNLILFSKKKNNF